MDSRVLHRLNGLTDLLRKRLPILRDQRGNTMAITAVILIPLLFLVGSSVDMSRAYLTKNRLQQACDAGVLAGRKVMTSGVDASVRDETRKFVNFNFPQGMTGTTPFSIDPVDGPNQSVDLKLSTKLPTAIMSMFGVPTMSLSVDCTARQDFINTDVMLVLDTTLSMNCNANESASTYCTTEKSSAKIKALRSGVESLYDTLKGPQTQLENAGLRLRYGIVPYSMTVNTGKLVYALNSSYIRNPAEYQQCNGKGCSTKAEKVTHDATWLNTVWEGCIEERQTVTSIDSGSGYSIPSGAKDLDIDSAPSSDATKWAPYDPAANNVKSNVAGVSTACPREARRMAPFASKSDLSSYLTSMKTGGYTYHDIGMIWAARLMSGNGLWSSDNPDSYKGFPVNRHVIFMTDGAMDPDLDAYTAYGVEGKGGGGTRVSGNGNASKQLESHTQRFRMMCNQTKGMNITVWVIAFGTSAGTGLSSELQNCASSPSNAFKADNQSQLEARFTQIGESIGGLRLSK